MERDDNVEGAKGGDTGCGWGDAGGVIVETGGDETETFAGDAREEIFDCHD